jgi:hypothetical protein
MPNEPTGAAVVAAEKLANFCLPRLASIGSAGQTLAHSVDRASTEKAERVCEISASSSPREEEWMRRSPAHAVRECERIGCSTCNAFQICSKK